MLSGIRHELRPMVSLAVPVILAEIGWTTMGLVDTLMVGPLGPAAIGAVGLGSIVFLAIGIFGMGLLLGLDTLVAQSFGAGRMRPVPALAAPGRLPRPASAVPLSRCCPSASRATLPYWGLNADVLVLASPYLNVVTLSVLPLLLYAAFRRYLQAVNLVRPITFALVSANLVNVAVNWVLIYGKLGFPALGATGAAWATVLSRVYMAAVLGFAVSGIAARRAAPLNESRAASTGTPCAGCCRSAARRRCRSCSRSGVFAAATALAGRLAPAALAAHQIALNLWSFVFMVPLGLNAAGAVRVGQAVGRRDREGVWRAGWTALALGAAFTASSAVVFFVAAGRSSARSRTTRPCSPSGRRCSPSPACAWSSTAPRASRPAFCAASAKRASRCSRTSRDTGSSGCRSATRRASGGDGACRACGSASRPASRPSGASCSQRGTGAPGGRCRRKPDCRQREPKTGPCSQPRAQTRPRHSRVSVLTFTFSPSLMKSDTRTSIPVSSFATFVTLPDAVSPRAPGSAEVTVNSTCCGS